MALPTTNTTVGMVYPGIWGVLMPIKLRRKYFTSVAFPFQEADILHVAKPQIMGGDLRQTLININMADTLVARTPSLVTGNLFVAIAYRQAYSFDTMHVTKPQIIGGSLDVTIRYQQLYSFDTLRAPKPILTNGSLDVTIRYVTMTPKDTLHVVKPTILSGAMLQSASVTGDPNFSKVQLLINGNTGAGSTTIVDASTNGYTQQNDPLYGFQAILSGQVAAVQDSSVYAGPVTNHGVTYSASGGPLAGLGYHNLDGSSYLTFDAIDIVKNRTDVTGIPLKMGMWFSMTTRPASGTATILSFTSGSDGYSLQVNSSGALTATSVSSGQTQSIGTINLAQWYYVTLVSHPAQDATYFLIPSIGNGYMGLSLKNSLSDVTLYLGWDGSGANKFQGKVSDFFFEVGGPIVDLNIFPPTAAVPLPYTSTSFAPVATTGFKPDGTQGTSLVFNGSTNKTQLPQTTNWDMFNSSVWPSFTIEFWINPTVTPYTQTILAFVAGPAYDQSYWGFFLDSGGTLYIRSVSGTTGVIPGDGQTISFGIWNHICVTYDASTSFMRIWLNGNLSAASPFAVASTIFPKNKAFMPVLGAQRHEVGPTPWFASTQTSFLKGTLRALRITKGFLRHTQNVFDPIGNDYPTAVPSGDPYWNRVALLIQGDGSGSSAKFWTNGDTTARTMTLANGVSLDTTQTYGSATSSLKFTGQSKGVVLPFATFPAITGALINTFCVDFWMRPTSLATNQILFMNNQGAAYPGILCRLVPAATSITLTLPLDTDARDAAAKNAVPTVVGTLSYDGTSATFGGTGGVNVATSTFATGNVDNFKFEMFASAPSGGGDTVLFEVGGAFQIVRRGGSGFLAIVNTAASTSADSTVALPSTRTYLMFGGSNGTYYLYLGANLIASLAVGSTGVTWSGKQLHVGGTGTVNASSFLGTLDNFVYTNNTAVPTTPTVSVPSAPLGPTGYLQIVFTNNYGIQIVSPTGALVITMNSWHHVAVQANDSHVMIYLDGKETPWIVSNAPGIISSSTDMLVGGQATGDSNTGFNGNMISFRIAANTVRYYENGTPQLPLAYTP